MAASQKNPSMFGKWTVQRFQAMVINDILPEVVFFTLVATMVVLVSEKTSTSLAVSNQMLTVLGTVLGLVVSFRTSSAYERYSEGRKLWGSIGLISRTIAQLIWIHVPNDRTKRKDVKVEDEDDEDKTRETEVLKAIIEKKTMINLLQAFSVSVKHMLRGEGGIYYEDLYPLICYLPRYCGHPPEASDEGDVLPLWSKSPRLSNVRDSRDVKHPKSPTASSQKSGENGLHDEKSSERTHVWSLNKRKKTFDPESVLPVVESDIRLGPSRNPPKATIYDYMPLFLVFRPFIYIIRYVLAKITCKDPPEEEDPAQGQRSMLGHKRRPMKVESSIPLEVTLYLNSYLAFLLRKGLLQPAIATALTNGIIALQDTVSNLDRIKTTPIPFAYQAHLRVSMWLYLFFLPFQIYGAYKYLTIPATAFASFLLLGFLEIGQEIENPFNYDPNDLDLDHFCLVLERELAEITVHPAPDPDFYVFGPWNQPFAPEDRRSAEAILMDKDHEYFGDSGLHSVQRTLLKSWREVSEVTSAHIRQTY